MILKCLMYHTLYRNTYLTVSVCARIYTSVCVPSGVSILYTSAMGIFSSDIIYYIGTIYTPVTDLQITPFLTVRPSVR